MAPNTFCTPRQAAGAVIGVVRLMSELSHRLKRIGCSNRRWSSSHYLATCKGWSKDWEKNAKQRPWFQLTMAASRCGLFSARSHVSFDGICGPSVTSGEG